MPTRRGRVAFTAAELAALLCALTLGRDELGEPNQLLVDGCELQLRAALLRAGSLRP